MVKYLWAVLYIQLHYKIFVKDQVFHKNTMQLFAKNFLCMILKCNMAKILVLKNDLKLTTPNCSNV